MRSLTPPKQRKILLSTYEERITGVTVSAFRGFPDTQTIDFTLNNRPTSMFLLGANGSGKSSIIDALEFGLQGGLGGHTVNHSAVPTLRNMHQTSSGDSQVSVILSSGRTVARNNVAGERHDFEIEGEPTFSHSRFVIRRNDLTDFSQGADQSRPRRLINYLRTGYRYSGVAPEGESASLRNEITRCNERKALLEERFAEACGLTTTEAPRSGNALQAMYRTARGITPEMTRSDIESLPRPRGEIRLALAALESETKTLKGLQNRLHDLEQHSAMLRLNAELDHVSDRVTEAFMRLCPQREAISALKYFATNTGDRGIELRISLPSGLTTSPTKILSEASLDLLAVLTYVHLTEASRRHGQAPVLILDDTFNSVDASVREAFAGYLFEQFSDWQIIVAFHDRLWFEQFHRIATAANHQHRLMEFGTWSALGGPRIYDSPHDASAVLREALNSQGLFDHANMAGRAGLLLETLCDQVSIGIELPLPRRLNSSYTLGQLWVPFFNYFKDSSIEREVKDIASSIHLRNLIGAHYNT